MNEQGIPNKSRSHFKNDLTYKTFVTVMLIPKGLRRQVHSLHQFPSCFAAGGGLARVILTDVSNNNSGWVFQRKTTTIPLLLRAS